MKLKKERERLKKFAVKVLGDKEAAMSWMKAPQIALGWKIPGECLATFMKWKMCSAESNKAYAYKAL